MLNQQFKLIANLKTPRRQAGAMDVQDSLIVFGGWDESGRDVKTIERLDADC